jgi:hypothetical protein
MIDHNTFFNQLREVKSYYQTLEIMNDPRTLTLGVELDLLNFKLDYKVYDWIVEHVTSFAYVGNLALMSLNLYYSCKNPESPHQTSERYLLIHNDDERMRFKMRFAHLIKAS